MTTLWRIFCTTEDQWVSDWSNSPITTCPNNIAHTVVNNSTQEITVEFNVYSLFFNLLTITNTSYRRIGKIYYDPQNGILRRLRFIAFKDGSTTNFTIQVYDITNTNELIASTSTNTDEDTCVDGGVLSNVPTSPAMLEIRVKKTGGTSSNDVVYIQHILLDGYIE